MKHTTNNVKTILIPLIALFTFSIAAGSAFAGERQYKAKKMMRINPGFIMKSSTSKLNTKKLTPLSCKAINKAENRHRIRVGILNNKYKACRVKAYSINAQSSAGCSNSDTLKQCNYKLLRWCARKQQSRYKQSYDLFKKRGTQLRKAVKARALKYWIFLN